MKTAFELLLFILFGLVIIFRLAENVCLKIITNINNNQLLITKNEMYHTHWYLCDSFARTFFIF